MADITAIILTKNEERNLPACLESLRGWVARIVVVDSFSDDSTCEIAREFGADVYLHEFENYGSQFQYAMDNTSIDTDWILRIDADERLTEAAACEIEGLCASDVGEEVSGAVLRFRIHFMGRELRHGGAYPMRKLCLFRRNRAFMEQRYMDEQIVVTSGRTVEVESCLEHDDYKDLTHWIAKHNWYATRAARDYFDSLSGEGKDASALDVHSKLNRSVKYKVYYKLPSRLRTWLYFAYRYYLRGGFLDGRPGYWYAFFQAYWYRTLVDAKIFEAEGRPETIREIGALR